MSAQNDAGGTRQAAASDWRQPLAATIVLQTTAAYLFHVIPTLAPALSDATGSGQSLAGWLVALNTVGSIAFLLAGTPLIRRYGAIRSLQAGLAVGALGLLLLPWPSVAAVAIGSTLMGLGYGPSSPAASDVLQRFAPAQHRVLIFSIRQAGVPLSGVIAGAMLPPLYTWGGWPAVLVVSLAMVGLAIAAVQPVRGRVDDERRRSDAITLGQILSPANLLVPLRAVRDASGLGRVAVAGACLAVGHGCWGAFFVTFAHEVLGLSLIDSGLAFAIMQGAGIFGRIGLGWLADQIGSGLVVLKGAAVASALCSLLLALSGPGTPFAVIAVLAAAAGLSVSSWNGVQIAVVAGAVPRSNITASTSGATVLIFLGYVLGPAIFALILGLTGSFPLAFIVTAVVTLVALILTPASLPRSTTERSHIG